jgi:hypothetical protein
MLIAATNMTLIHKLQDTTEHGNIASFYHLQGRSLECTGSKILGAILASSANHRKLITVSERMNGTTCSVVSGLCVEVWALVMGSYMFP